MSQVNLNQNPAVSTAFVNDAGLEGRLKQTSIREDDSLPPSKDTGQSSSLSELPVLPKPSLAAGSSIALEILLDAIGDEVRQSETHAGIATVKANADAREAANKEKIKKIDEQIEKLEKASIWDKIGSIFKYIGMAVAAVACVAMIATGVGSAAGVAGLVLLGVSVADQVLDAIGTAVNGQGWGLTSLIGLAVEKSTGNQEAAQWVKFGLDLAISIAAIACTCGASAGSAASSLEKVAGVISKVSTITQAATGAAAAGSQIAGAVYTKDAEDARAAQKRLEAVLEQIQMINDLVTKHMKQVIEDSQKVAETVTDIVKDNAAVQTDILTGGGGAAMA